jgi:hypothetical protein
MVNNGQVDQSEITYVEAPAVEARQAADKIAADPTWSEQYKGEQIKAKLDAARQEVEARAAKRIAELESRQKELAALAYVSKAPPIEQGPVLMYLASTIPAQLESMEPGDIQNWLKAAVQAKDEPVVRALRDISPKVVRSKLDGMLPAGYQALLNEAEALLTPAAAQQAQKDLASIEPTIRAVRGVTYRAAEQFSRWRVEKGKFLDGQQARPMVRL